MDIKMPVMNGWNTIKIIKELAPTIPIIVQTAYASTHDKNRALELGCADYISKPIKSDVFRSIINKYLN